MFVEEPWSFDRGSCFLPCNGRLDNLHMLETGRLASWLGGLYLRRQHPLLVTKLDLDLFGTFLIGDIGSACGVMGSVAAWHESSGSWLQR